MLPLVIRIKDLEMQPPKERQYVFTHSPVRIGRNQLNDISIPKSFVSLFHALVRFNQKSIHVVDLDSTNGLSIDGRRIDKNVPVRVDEETRVTIGTIELRLSREAAASVGDGQSRMTQFRALATLQAPDDGTPMSFKPTPVQGREQVVATTMLPALSDAAIAQSRRQEEGSPRTVLVPALDEELERQDPGQRTIISGIPIPDAEPVTAPAGRRANTSDSVRVVAPPPAASSSGLQSPIQQLVPLYTAYRNAWQTLHESMVRQAGTLPEADRASFVAQLQRHLPGVAHEPQFGRFARSLGVALPQSSGGNSQVTPVPAAPGGGSRLDGMARELLGQFVRSYLPGSKGLDSGLDIDRFLDRLADVLETFGRAFVELRQGHDQFGQEMAVMLPRDVTPLANNRNTREVLRYLLDWKAPDSAERVQELRGGFVDVMIHQIALLNGMREGVKDLLQRLLPGELEGSKGGSFFSRLWPFQASRKLTRLEERVKTLMEEERELSAVLFGPEFAKAYHAIVGDAANKSEDGEVPVVSKRRARESSGT
ncbi:FHA domain-containing protein [Myxococcus sp. K15C18031901]|uniref:FHA domain-containing protein n=1 Tax=Myxococcus dinghuensis TaxID=2906761 RepID=UPI0020A7E682|nr:FHA domain-containing protein [Myxococcus dinghuensis]MCP3098201.1 FHA domain-containing protein [Myxococcus dinghuensis]